MVCRCGCAETMHSKKWGCGTCGCMKFAPLGGWRADCENHTQRDGWQEKLTMEVDNECVVENYGREWNNRF